MTIAYWCVLVVIVLPYIYVAIAVLPTITLEKNLIPRIANNSLTGYRQRLYWAHLNALEAIAPFAATVIIAHSLYLDQELLDTLALAFVGFRLAHAVMYVADLGIMRSAVFFGGMVCMVSIFINVA